MCTLERRWDSWMHDHVYLHQQVHCFWFAGVWQELQKHEDKSVQSMNGLLGHFFAHRNRPGDHGYGWGAGSLVLGTLTQQSCDCFALDAYWGLTSRQVDQMLLLSIHFNSCFQKHVFFSRNIWSPFGHYSMTTFAYMYVYIYRIWVDTDREKLENNHEQRECQANTHYSWKECYFIHCLAPRFAKCTECTEAWR
jgi:hypothetical protein